MFFIVLYHIKYMYMDIYFIGGNLYVFALCTVCAWLSRLTHRQTYDVFISYTHTHKRNKKYRLIVHGRDDVSQTGRNTILYSIFKIKSVVVCSLLFRHPQSGCRQKTVICSLFIVFGRLFLIRVVKNRQSND